MDDPDLKADVHRVALALLDQQTAMDEETARRVNIDPDDADLTAIETAMGALHEALGTGWSTGKPSTDEQWATAKLLFGASTLITQLISRLADAEGSSREVVTAEMREYLGRVLG